MDPFLYDQILLNCRFGVSYYIYSNPLLQMVLPSIYCYSLHLD